MAHLHERHRHTFRHNVWQLLSAADEFEGRGMVWWGLFGMVIGAGVAGSWWMQPCFELLHWEYLLENGQNQKTASSRPTEVVDLGRDEAVLQGNQYRE